MQLDQLDIDAVLENSYRDYTVKGVDYICLYRSPERTEKLYFFENITEAPEVVAPHDHRYPLSTQCLRGTVTNYSYAEGNGPAYTRWSFFTPLLNGQGFEYAGDTRLAVTKTVQARAGQTYHMPHHEIHTIGVKPGTVIKVTQYADVVPVGTPTRTFTRGSEPPDLRGLYNRFTADEIVRRLQALELLSQ